MVKLKLQNKIVESKIITIMKIGINKFVNNWQSGDGVQRVIDNDGTIIDEHYDPNGGISVDWISAEWLQRQGKLTEKEKLQRRKGEHIHVFLRAD